MRAPIKSLTIAALAAIGVFAVEQATAVPPVSAAKVGEPAPNFTAPDISGKTIRLGDYSGKTIVLEWTNNGCPFVGKHYDSGNMQSLQQKYATTGVVWLTIASSAPGEEGYVTPAEAKADLARWRAAPSNFLLDPDGVVGHLYDARATPHMVVIDRAGRIAYMGAIDDKPSTRVADVKTAHNYVAAALDALAAGQPVAVASTRAYGCSIKYRDS
jgi:hypothetical protein